MNGERDEDQTPDRFTPDTLDGAAPAYGANEPYDPGSPVSQTEQSPLGGPIDADRVVAQINDQLKQHRELDGSHIEVTYEEGVVILSGSVGSEEGRALAEEATQSVTGVTAVDNDLKIAPQKPGTRSEG